MSALRILVCGGRDFTDREWLFDVLDRAAKAWNVGAIIHGAARGADTLAGEWARSRGVEEIARPADWQKHGRAAGPIRNLEMLDLKPDGVVAFPGGRGTAHMCEIAEKAGIGVFRWDNPPARAAPRDGSATGQEGHGQ